MKKQIDIWIDTERAVIICFDGQGHVVNTVDSSIEGRVRIPGESKQFARFGNQYFNFEEKKEHRLTNSKHKFFKNIIDQLKDADEIVLFGPSLMKIECQKYLQNDHGISAQLDPVETTDQMTENQMAAWVKKYYLDKIAT